VKYVKYLKYLFWHKWYVFVACCEHRLIWRGLIHDWSKFLPSEFFPYANYFYGKRKPIEAGQSSAGYCKPTATDDEAFDFAWLLHQKRNRHHFQFWICPQDDGGTKIFPMPEPYRTEMLCDWIGAGKAQGKPDTASWYMVNEAKMQLHPDTRAWIEEALGVRFRLDMIRKLEQLTMKDIENMEKP